MCLYGVPHQTHTINHLYVSRVSPKHALHAYMFEFAVICRSGFLQLETCFAYFKNTHGKRIDTIFSLNPFAIIIIIIYQKDIKRTILCETNLNMEMTCDWRHFARCRRYLCILRRPNTSVTLIEMHSSVAFICTWLNMTILSVTQLTSNKEINKYN